MNNSDATSFRRRGSAKEGSAHWLAQRITAIALVILVFWFLLIVAKISISPLQTVVELLRSPFNLSMLCLLVGVSLYHGSLGMRVVIEDYIHCEKAKFILLILIKFISIISFLVCLTSIITFYFSAFI
jgi:succinate dehydrogenase / fumarate reductase membrane anchor subunit